MTTIMLARVLGVLGCGVAAYMLWNWALNVQSDTAYIRKERREKFQREATKRWEGWESSHILFPRRGTVERPRSDPSPTPRFPRCLP